MESNNLGSRKHYGATELENSVTLWGVGPLLHSCESARDAFPLQQVHDRVPNEEEAVLGVSTGRSGGEGPVITAGALDSGQGGGVALFESVEESRNFLATGRCDRVEGGNCTSDQATAKLGREAGGIKGEAPLPKRYALVPEAIGGPGEGFLCFGQGDGASSESGGIDPVGFGEAGAETGAIVALVVIAWVADGVEVGSGHDRLQVGTTPAEERPDNVAVNRTDPGEARDSGAAVQAHQQCFGLVVGMVGGSDPIEALPISPRLQQGITGGSGGGLEVAFDRLRREQDFVRHAETRANFRDEFGFGGAFGPQAMVDGGGVNLPGQRRVSEKQQREAVRTARDGDPEPYLEGAGERLEVAAEAVDQLLIGR